MSVGEGGVGGIGVDEDEVVVSDVDFLDFPPRRNAPKDGIAKSMRWNECQNNSPQIPLVSIQMFSWCVLVGGQPKWILREMNEIRRPDVGSCKIWGTGDFTQSVRC